MLPWNTSIGTVYEDVTTDVLGEIGKWQWIVTFVAFMFMIPAFFNQYGDMFLLEPKQIVCILPDYYRMVNSSYCIATSWPVKNSTEQFYCDKWHIQLLWTIWIKKTWLIFCEDRLRILSVAVIFRLGSVFGCVIFGIVSDSFGRKSSIIINMFVDIILGLTLTFCNSEPWFRLLVFLKAVFSNPNIYLALILVCETSSNGWRSSLALIVALPRLLSAVYTVPLANSSPNIETYSFIACLYGLLLVFILRWIPESPQWLLFNRKIARAEKIIFAAAKVNGVNLCSEFKIRPVNYRAYVCLDEGRTFIRMFSAYNTRVVVLCCLAYWFFYGTLWSLLYTTVHGQILLTSTLYSAVLCIIVLYGFLVIMMSKCFRLQYVFVANATLTGVFTDILCETSAALAIATGVVGFGIMYITTPRLFAINIRASLVGGCQAAAELATIISYCILNFYIVKKTVSVVIVIVLTGVLIPLSFMFPEINGREMPDVLEDMDFFSELSKPRRWTTQKTDSPSSEEFEMRIYSFGSTGCALSSRTLTEHDERPPPKQIGLKSMIKNKIRAFRKK